MRQKIKNFINKEKLLNHGDKVIIGVSGGADSVALVHILNSLGYECLIAHCNFHLRGEESDRDEKFVTDFAASLNLPFQKQDFDTRKIAKERKISIEMAARELRYKWFGELKEINNADAIAVAHHSDDNIETLLLNLIRGTGIKGLTGIQPLLGSLVRPLLCVTKKEILQYISEKKLSFVTDSSNEKDEWIRNKIRLQVIPLLEKINPSVRKSIVQTIDNLNEVIKIYDTEIEKAIKEIFNQEKGSISISLLKKYPSQESILFELLNRYGFGKEVIHDIYNSINSQPGKLFYARDYFLVRDRDEFLLSTLIKDEEKEYTIYEIDVFLEHPLGMEISLHKGEKNVFIEKKQNIAYFDYDKISFPLTLRKWKNGDRFIPSGMKSFQKISDYFTNHKFSKIQKEKTWILTSGKDVVWIVNHRIDERFKSKNETKNHFIIKLL